MIKLNIQLFGGGTLNALGNTMSGSLSGTHGGTGNQPIIGTSAVPVFDTDFPDEEVISSGLPHWRDFVSTGGGDGLKHNNLMGLYGGRSRDLQIAFELYITNGNVMPTYAQFIAAGGQDNGRAWNNIEHDLREIVVPAWTKEIEVNPGILANIPEGVIPPSAPAPEVQSENPRDIAYKSHFNRYYDDVMSTAEGTMGKRILDNNISLYEKEASNAGILADTGLQAGAMAQAQGVKQVTDALRSERMAQLRAGMSESQLADRELQMLIGSTNQMAQQAQMSSQEATAAQLASNTAREYAFNDYITQATQLGQNAGANYASEVGDVYALTSKIMRDAQAAGRPITWDKAFAQASGSANTN
jgi:hypothetical protein